MARVSTESELLRDATILTRRLNGEHLKPIGADYGLSHEGVRLIVKRTMDHWALGVISMLEDDGRAAFALPTSSIDEGFRLLRSTVHLLEHLKESGCEFDCAWLADGGDGKPMLELRAVALAGGVDSPTKGAGTAEDRPGATPETF